LDYIYFGYVFFVTFPNFDGFLFGKIEQLKGLVKLKC